MGATNVMLAYQLYAGRVPATSMQLLAYMALVSKDSDTRPWCSVGHEALAAFAMGRPAPITDADVRAVRRAITPLLAAGAIETERRAAPRRDGHTTARYRLHLVAGAAESIDEPLVDNPPADRPESTERRTENGGDVGRKVVERRTKNGQTQDGNRPTEEPRGTRRSDMEENHLGQVGNSPPSTGALATHRNIDASRDPPSECESCGAWLDPDGSCRNRQCDSSVAVVIPIRRTA